MSRFVWLIFLFVVPSTSFAAVSFSEIAWMGSANSANHEWIEFYNDGQAVDVTGWRVVDGMNLDIELVGIIPAGAHVVIERTSDASAEGEAFMIYTGALVNTGATLQLKRSDGTIEDQVHGGSDWSLVGGDNVTKETAQYTSKGWVTAPASPGNATIYQEPEVVESENIVEKKEVTVVANTEERKPKSSGRKPVKMILPEITLELSVDMPAQGFVNQPIVQSVQASGVGDTLINSLEYDWNFGDGNVGLGREVEHVFEYPGTYVVTTFASYKRQHAVIENEITILPVRVSLTQNSAGDVQVNNDSPYRLDVSQYKLNADTSFVFPDRTYLLPNQTITIPVAKIGAVSNRMIALYDTAGSLLTSVIPGALQGEQILIAQTVSEPLPRISSISYSPTTEIEKDTVGPVVNSEPEVSLAEAVDTRSNKQLKQDRYQVTSNERLPYVLLLVTVILVIFGIYLAPRRNF